MGILAASLPILCPLFARLIDSTRGYFSSASSHKDSCGLRRRSTSGYAKEDYSTRIAKLPETQERPSKSGNVVTMATESRNLDTGLAKLTTATSAYYHRVCK